MARQNIVGTSGADRISVTGNGEVVDGLGGVDTLVLNVWHAYIGGWVTDITLGQSQTTPTLGMFNPYGSAFTFKNIENVVGSAFVDTIRGSAGDNLLDGGAGNDMLDGRAGNDTLIGGLGADTLTGGAGLDRFAYGSTDESFPRRVDVIACPPARPLPKRNSGPTQTSRAARTSSTCRPSTPTPARPGTRRSPTLPIRLSTASRANCATQTGSSRAT